ncbi:hypothetical protein [Lysinibacillus sp. NPDC056232]|uniref:hypothetical protein n=1 Tax=Lysinibacillus sp. NPDC056232 TaxID=3345756 RepID=UPI0035E2E38F
MGFFIVIMGFIILVVVMNILKKESPTNDRSARSHSHDSNTHTIDHNAISTFVSVEDSNTHNCSDSVASFADTSSCNDSGSSSD